LYLTAPPGDPRLFIVEKGGRVLIVRDGEVRERPFLDVQPLVSRGSEQGLLSMAFHPDYASNGRFFVSYTNLEGDSRVVEYRVSGDPDVADPSPVRAILAVEQPFSNHNGGLITFGPDRMLYVGLGDGGSGGDPEENGQDLGTLLGKILRLDVDGAPPYEVPPDNPFVGQGGARGEIWAYGLRNPWRFSFDRDTRDVFVADVGQGTLEELNAVPVAEAAGVNYGWDVTEGTRCFEPSQGCDRTGFTLPVEEYGHSGGACSVTGGYVYRGSALPRLRGVYFYGDFCAGFVRSFRFSGGAAVMGDDWPQLAPAEGQLSSFGEDAAGELYVLSGAGSVYKVVPE
jgi:glucose/arabinose dehydrogenase